MPRQIPQRYKRLVERSANFICRYQLPSGAIPYYEGDVIDPWDHVECAIALSLCGRREEAAKAYDWLRLQQNLDGSWYYNYLDGHIPEKAKDSNHSTYVATGVWHHYLATKDEVFLEQMWPVVEKGIDFALTLQQPTGDIYWALGADGKPWESGLHSGSSCIWWSINNGLKIAGTLGLDRPQWRQSNDKLYIALTQNPHLFEKRGENKRDYAMHWYYPVLCGVQSGNTARQRIEQRWSEFIVPGWGCLCSLDQPWVTPAETCELIMALTNIGEIEKAERLLEWILKEFADDDGGFWTGIRVPERIIYPENHKTTWTTAAVIMAIMALAGNRKTGD